MRNTQKKIKVKTATAEEVMAITAQAVEKLESATVGQLQASLTAIAGAFIELVTECPDLQTKYSLAMVVISQTLDDNAGAVSLQDTIPIECISPTTTTTN